MRPPALGLPLLAEVVRGGRVESVHAGSVVALDPSGEVVLAVGDVSTPVFARSALKPMQALGLLRAGLPVAADQPRLLAIAQASHSGEPHHLALVRQLLAQAGATEADLGCTPDLPLDVAAARDSLRAGGGPSALTHNCSGKHAGMIATRLADGAPVPGYLDPASPLQQALQGTVEQLCGEPVGAVAVDGCGAPALAVSLRGLAGAVAALVEAPPGSDERRVVDAGRAHPEVVGGTGRDVTLLMRHLPGLYAKDGAEGVYVAALPGAGAVALKIADGAARARVPVLLAALQLLQPDVVAGVDPAVFAVPVLGGGQVVGEVRALPLR